MPNTFHASAFGHVELTAALKTWCHGCCLHVGEIRVSVTCTLTEFGKRDYRGSTCADSVREKGRRAPGYE
eukprot:1928393-Amphidinium_carterae.1